jgi:hypothetical protein
MDRDVHEGFSPQQLVPQQQVEQTFRRNKLDTNYRKSLRDGQQSRAPKQVGLEAVPEDSHHTYVKLKDPPHRKSYNQPPAEPRQRITATYSKHGDKSRRHYRSDDSSYHGGYSSRDEALWDMSDCRRALQDTHSAAKGVPRQARRASYHKK